MKEPKITGLLFYISSVLFYLAAILKFASRTNTYTGIVWLVLGSLFLCLGIGYTHKSKKDDKKE